MKKVITNQEDSNKRQWTFISNHGHVLVCLAKDSGMRLRDIAARVGITERAVQKIIQDFEAAGIISRKKEGRRNTYKINDKLPLRHPLESHRSIGDFIRMVIG